MNHILVPSSVSNSRNSAQCGVHAMELLINGIMKLGGDRRGFVAKAFGGGNVLPGFITPTVGELNSDFVREFLLAESIPLVAQRMGGLKAVRVSFHTYTGRAFVHTIDGSRLPAIIREETSYYHTGVEERFHPVEPKLF